MQLEKLRIKNYRSIVDSGDCYLVDKGLTILAGKNESGKTSILEALESFNYKSKIGSSNWPVGGNSDNQGTEIVVTFQLTKENTSNILCQVYKNLGVDIDDDELGDKIC